MNTFIPIYLLFMFGLMVGCVLAGKLLHWPFRRIFYELIYPVGLIFNLVWIVAMVVVKSYNA